MPFLQTSGDEFLYATQKFLHILLTTHSFRTHILNNLSHYTAFTDDFLCEKGGIHQLCFLDETGDNIRERLQFTHRTPVYGQGMLFGTRHHFPQADPVCGGCGYNLIHRGLAYPSCRIIDDPFESLLVMGIYGQTAIGYHIFYFLSLVERKSSVNPIRHTPFAQSLFKSAALCVGTVKNGKIIIFHFFFSPQRCDLVYHDFGFFDIAISGIHMKGRTFLLVAENILRYLSVVMAYQTVGSRNDCLCRTVVLFQFKQLCIVIFLREIKDIINICSTKAINALCIVSHYAHLLFLVGQFPYDTVLGIIRVLILIHQNEIEFVRISLADLGMFFEQYISIEQ